MVRFRTIKQMNDAFNGGPQFSDSKPLIMKPWHADMEILKDELKTIPIWIRFPKQDIKY
ncbi:Lipoyl synthase mitochondrial [Bienertia sinuspersici]